MSEPGERAAGTARGARSKTAILEAAVPLVAEHGYRGVSLASIAAAASLTQPGLLHHFHSKQELLLALLAERDRSDSQRVNASEQEGLKLLSALQALVKHNRGKRDLVQLFSVLVGESVSPSHPAHAYFVERYAGVREQLLESLRKGQEKGEIRPDANLEAVVRLLVAVMDGLQIQWLLDPHVDMVADFKQLTRMLERELAVTDEPRTETR
ncbi:MAG: TetR family transcriptional regulator [Gaiellaceae bacterium]